MLFPLCPLFLQWLSVLSPLLAEPLWERPMATRHRLSLVVVLSVLFGSFLMAADTTSDVVTAVTRQGGHVTFDEFKEGRPIIAIRVYDVDPASPCLALIAGVTTLADLQISGDAVTDDSLRQLQKLTNLKSLRISSRKITDAGLPHLAGIEALRGLNLRCSTRITDQGLAHLGKMKQIERLALFMQATPAGIASLQGMTALRELSLNNMQITDAAITPLRQLPGLRVLHLTSTPITDACLDDLMALPQLEKLDIRHTKISKASIGRLQAALPKCEILR